MTYELIDMDTLNTVASFETLIDAVNGVSGMDDEGRQNLVLVSFDQDGIAQGARYLG